MRIHPHDHGDGSSLVAFAGGLFAIWMVLGPFYAWRLAADSLVAMEPVPVETLCPALSPLSGDVEYDEANDVCTATTELVPEGGLPARTVAVDISADVIGAREALRSGTPSMRAAAHPCVGPAVTPEPPLVDADFVTEHCVHLKEYDPGFEAEFAAPGQRITVGGIFDPAVAVTPGEREQLETLVREVTESTVAVLNGNSGQVRDLWQLRWQGTVLGMGLLVTAAGAGWLGAHRLWRAHIVLRLVGGVPAAPAAPVMMPAVVVLATLALGTGGAISPYPSSPAFYEPSVGDGSEWTMRPPAAEDPVLDRIAPAASEMAAICVDLRGSLSKTGDASSGPNIGDQYCEYRVTIDGEEVEVRFAWAAVVPDLIPVDPAVRDICAGAPPGVSTATTVDDVAVCVTDSGPGLVAHSVVGFELRSTYFEFVFLADDGRDLTGAHTDLTAAAIDLIDSAP
ncbi:hypothetical protein [Stackebrandtia soli]|uniref:hypothetical protein n=1 Tax=Stackebrandtia soli TaxID=1892856 RepID=UPI0039E85155